MCKHCFIILAVLAISCKPIQNTVNTSNLKKKLHCSDNVELYTRLQKKIINKVESQTSFDNKITEHFKKFITPRALEQVKFKEWRKNIYIEFTVDKNKQVVFYNTNTSSQALDLQIKIAFKSFEFDLMNIQQFDPIYKYSIVVVQNINNKPTVKCNDRAIGYAPPVFQKCTNQKTYDNLNRCNYEYITDYLYNHVDLSYATASDIDNRDGVYPKLIIDPDGKIVAAKVESKNKELLQSYYQAIKSIPTAIKPARLDNQNEYYGYNFPTSISNIISNNKRFKEHYSQNIQNSGAGKTALMKSFLNKLHEEKRMAAKYKKDGFKNVSR